MATTSSRGGQTLRNLAAYVAELTRNEITPKGAES
jgi:hypothetical protein